MRLLTPLSALRCPPDGNSTQQYMQCIRFHASSLLSSRLPSLLLSHPVPSRPVQSPLSRRRHFTSLLYFPLLCAGALRVNASANLANESDEHILEVRTRTATATDPPSRHRPRVLYIVQYCTHGHRTSRFCVLCLCRANSRVEQSIRSCAQGTSH